MRLSRNKAQKPQSVAEKQAPLSKSSKIPTI